MITAKTWHDNRSILWMYAASGLLGIVLVADGILTPGMRQHRLFALFVGGLLALPLTGSVLLGVGFLDLAKKFLFSLGPALGLLLVLEVAARTVGADTLSRPEVRSDPELGFVMVPGTTGVDAWGFRNAAVPPTAEIVFLGDSNTYGFGVSMTETLPMAVSKLTGATTYNMGIGGYGPIQYLALADRALALEPRVVVIGFYFGNDFLDAHVLAGLEGYRDLRDPDLAYEGIGESDSLAEERNLASAALIGLERHSRFVGWVTKHIRLELRTNKFLSGLYGQESDAPRYEKSPIETIFNPRLDVMVMNVEDPRVRDGVRITRVCLERLWSELEEAGVTPVLLLLHTKEYYYFHLMRSLVPGSEKALAQVEALEAKLTEELEAFAESRDGMVVDPLANIVDALRQGTTVFPKNSDGHPTGVGYAIIASTLVKALEKR